MWVYFAKDFDFSPSARRGHVTIEYKAGMRANVTRECFDAAKSVGAISQDTSHEDTESRAVQA